MASASHILTPRPAIDRRCARRRGEHVCACSSHRGSCVTAQTVTPSASSTPDIFIRQADVLTPSRAKHVARRRGPFQSLFGRAVGARLAACEVAEAEAMPECHVLGDRATDTDSENRPDDVQRRGVHACGIAPSYSGAAKVLANVVARLPPVLRRVHIAMIQGGLGARGQLGSVPIDLPQRGFKASSWSIPQLQVPPVACPRFEPAREAGSERR